MTNPLNREYAHYETAFEFIKGVLVRLGYRLLKSSLKIRVGERFTVVQFAFVVRR